MNDLNNFLIDGNIVRDPESKSITGSNLFTFTIASNRYKKGGEKKVGFFDVKYWAESFTGEKGDKVRIVGRIEQESWEKDGIKTYKIIIVAENISIQKKFKGDKVEVDDKEVLTSSIIPF